MPSFDELKAQGNRAFADKEYKRAAKIYRDALAQHGDHPVLYSNRAQCFLHLQDWPRAYRDTQAGLSLDTSDKIKVKLLFRKGTATKELGLIPEAIQCFQAVLDIDSSNSGALSELDKLMDTPKYKKFKASSGGFPIPLDLVDELPQEFADIVSPPSSSTADPMEYMKKSVNLDLVESVSKELFGNKPQTQLKQKNDAAPVNHFTLLPSMHFLKALKLVSPDKKAQAYRYAAGLEDASLVSLFQATGIDTEFFEFYIEACTFIVAQKLDLQTINGVLSKLRLIGTFSRFSLTLTMCDRKVINDLVSAFGEVSPDSLEQLLQILQ